MQSKNTLSSQPIVPETSELAFRAFIRSYGLFRNVMEPYFAQFGISSAHWGVLRTLHRARKEGEPGLQLNALAERLLIRPPSVTGIVDRLERKGLVKRTVTPADHRAKRVVLTAKGTELVDRVLQQHPAQIRNVLGGLSPERQREFLLLIEQFSAYLETLIKNRPVPTDAELGKSDE